MSNSDIDNILNDLENGKLSDQMRSEIAKAIAVEKRKEEIWSKVASQTTARNSNLRFRTFMRYAAAIFVPLAIVGTIWAGDILGLFSSNSNGDAKTELSAPAQTDELVKDYSISFEQADLQTVVAELEKEFSLSGVRILNDGDSVLVTTSFENQPIEEILDELKIHFGLNFALSDDGFLTISE